MLQSDNNSMTVLPYKMIRSLVSISMFILPAALVNLRLWHAFPVRLCELKIVLHLNKENEVHLPDSCH